MFRFITKLEFDVKNNKIKITDTLSSWEIDGDIKDFCPRILDRWQGYIDRVRQEYEEKSVEK